MTTKNPTTTVKSFSDRIRWILKINGVAEDRLDNVVNKIFGEIEQNHRIINPDVITEEMLEACFNALPEHYDPPDMKRRVWHALKAKRRFTAMVLAAEKINVE